MHASLPDSPLALLPSAPNQVTSVNLDQLRASSHFASVRELARRSGCIDSKHPHFLLDRSDRAAFATYAQKDSPQIARGVLVLHGMFEAGDLPAALQQAGILRGIQRAPVFELPAREFPTWTAGGLSAVAFGDHLIAVGDENVVAEVVAVAAGKRANWLSDPALMPEFDSQAWFAQHTFALLARVDERTAQGLGHALSSMGQADLASGLEKSSAAVALVLSDSVRLDARIRYPSASDASGTEEQIHALLAQAGLVLQLFGLPAALGRPDVRSEGQRLLLSLTLSNEDMHTLTDRFSPLLEAELPSCPRPNDAVQARRDP